MIPFLYLYLSTCTGTGRNYLRCITHVVCPKFRVLNYSWPCDVFFARAPFAHARDQSIRIRFEIGSIQISNAECRTTPTRTATTTLQHYNTTQHNTTLYCLRRNERMTMSPSTADDSFLPPFFLYGMTAGFVGVFVFFGLARDVLIPKLATKAFRERLSGLSRKDKNFLYITLPSMVHAIAHSFFHPAWISFGFSPEHNENRVTYFDDTWPAFFSGVFVGYLVGDLTVLGPKDLGPVYLIHHISASAIWTISASFRSMQWYASLLQFAEFSTIFLNIRQVVLTAGYPSSAPISLAASLSFFLSFLAARILPLPTLVRQWLTKDYDAMKEERGMTLAVCNSAALLIHVGLQSFWFFLMIKTIVGMAIGKKKQSKEKKEA
jgi:hypothetical protein